MKGGIAVEENKKIRAETEDGFAEHFLKALFETYRHQYGECTITEVQAEDKTA